MLISFYLWLKLEGGFDPATSLEFHSLMSSIRNFKVVEVTSRTLTV